MAMVHIDVAAPQEFGELSGVLAIAAHEKALLTKIFGRDRGAIGERMLRIHRQAKPFAEQAPAVEALPHVADRGRDAELSIAPFQILRHLRACSVQELEPHAAKMLLQLHQARDQQAHIDGP
jgi:hypothetical protein